MLFLVSLFYPFLCSSVMVLVPFWSPKSIKRSINIGLVGKSADMRLDRAGSIGLRVGPLQIAPQIQKNVLEIRRDFKAEFLFQKVAKVSKQGSQMGYFELIFA